MHVTPTIFFRRILRSEALVYKSFFFSERPFYVNYSTLDSHTNTVICHAFASRWRRKPRQSLLKTRMNWQKEKLSQKQFMSESFDNDNKLTLKSFFAFCSVFFFFTRTNGGKMETTSRQTQCPVSKILQRHIKELKLTVLLVLAEKTFSTWRICLFYFLGKPLLCAIVFVHQ